MQQNLQWWKYWRCTVMSTFIECKCCNEFRDLLDDQLSGGCVANHEAFHMLIMNKSVLDDTFKNNFTEVKS